jgi:hypothetical protein
MSRTKVLAILLLISWTLNVALGVSLYYQRHSRSPHLNADRFAPPGFPPEMPPFPPDELEALRSGAGPLMHEQKRLAAELFAVLTADSLDSLELEKISDSLGEVRCRMQSVMIDKVAQLHDRMTPEQREKICRKMMGRMGGEGFRHPERHQKGN